VRVVVAGFDAVILRRAMEIKTHSGLWSDKLMYWDGLDVIRICIGYRTEECAVIEALPMLTAIWVWSLS